MKVRMLAVLSSVLLAAWLPIHAQQPAAPAAPTQQPQSPAPAKHDCCPAKAQSASGEATHDHSAMACCHGKAGDEAKASCCQGKDKEAKDMVCCSKAASGGKSVMNCCHHMKDGQCAAKDGKSCCEKMTAKDGKSCCEGMADHRPAHASGK